jgi:hypothetical protein
VSKVFRCAAPSYPKLTCVCRSKRGKVTQDFADGRSRFVDCLGWLFWLARRCIFRSFKESSFSRRGGREEKGMDKAELVNTIASYLIIAAPYLKQIGKVAGGEAIKEASKQAIKKIGDGSWTVAKSIWENLTASKPENLTALDATLTTISEHPNDMTAQAMLRQQIEGAVVSDSMLVQQLVEILREAKPTHSQGSRNATFGEGANNNIVVTGDGIVIGDHNINLVNKKD